RLETEEPSSRVVQEAEEERREDRREHDDRERDEHGPLDRARHLYLPRLVLRIEDVHVPNDPGVVVQGERAVQDPGHAEPGEPSVEGRGIDRAGEEHELREEAAEGRDPRESEEEDGTRDREERQQKTLVSISRYRVHEAS